ncbi:MAG TPA: diaminopimelate epimerase [Methanobacterium sp.]|nr:diaminopimelate epimerase [Methanobacterium sp.]
MTLKEIQFSKMHGLGNDYIVIDETKGEVIPENKKNEISFELCRRGFSIGSDGVIFVCPSTNEDIKFRIFNSDGSEAEMCGNGIRCFSKYVYDNGILKKDVLNVETLGGTKKVTLTIKNSTVSSAKVDMGMATFKPSEIPMESGKDEVIQEEIDVNRKPYKVTAVSVGNPHAIIFTDNLEEVPLNQLGPVIETHKAFPQKTNVHFVKVINRDEIDMITWERGAGVTFACGTGATSCAIASFKLGLVDKNVLVHLPGGDLQIEIYEKENHLGGFMEGDAVLVFDGVIELNI